MTERWSSINDWPSYEISDLGRVRRVTPYRSTQVGKILKTFDLRGYEAVRVRVNGKRVTRTIHRLVAESFIGPIPQGLQVNHRDGDKKNNRPNNLEFVTCAENLRHARRLGLHQTSAHREKYRILAKQRVADGILRCPPESYQRGDAHWTHRRPDEIICGEEMPSAKLTEKQVREIITLRVEGLPLKVIAERYGVSVQNVSMVARGETWKHVHRSM